jgi:hypothetical protein
MAKQTKAQQQEKEGARAELRRLLPPGSVVYCLLRHVSSSGMVRSISLYTIKRNEPVFLTGYVCVALGLKRDKYDGATVHGCGMDMGFHLVQTLSYALHGYEPKGEGALPENAGRPYMPKRNSYRAGYSLVHRWL